MTRHPLHGLARCPYHPTGGELTRHGGPDGTLTCSECNREFPVESGIYRLMPDDMLDVSSEVPDQATAQKLREMGQRNDRAAVIPAGYVESLPGSALEWMNVQHAAVTRLAHLPADGVCADFGTGTGRYLPWILARTPAVVATDFSIGSLRRVAAWLTPEQRARCLLIQSDLSRLGLAGGVVSGGLCVEVLQHLPSAGLRRAAVRELARTLAPGAELCLVTKSRTSTSWMLGRLRLAAWWLETRLGQRGTRPMVEAETLDGAIYTYRYAYPELRNELADLFEPIETRGIISFGNFPVTLLPREWRLRADAWLERRRLGTWLGQDMLFRVVRTGSGAGRDGRWS